MSKISAEQFSQEGDKYLGRSYEEMDCQEFYERCLADAGGKMDLKGSNAWYREFLKNGWAGSPEACKAKFGSIPKGATLFIHAYDGGEEERGYHDGLGNASHIGIKTGRGKGAIHSSYSRGCVAESDFHDKTIPNGGWNMVGLHTMFTYGAAIDELLANEKGGGSGGDDDKGDDEHGGEGMYTAYIRGGNENKPINIRKKPNGDLQEQLPQGSMVTVLSEEDGWCKIEYQIGKRQYTGYVMSQFVVKDDDDPGGDDDPSGDPDEKGDDRKKEKVTITLSMTAGEAEAILPVLEKLVDEIGNKIGRG